MPTIVENRSAAVGGAEQGTSVDLVTLKTTAAKLVVVTVVRCDMLG